MHTPIAAAMLLAFACTPAAVLAQTSEAAGPAPTPAPPSAATAAPAAPSSATPLTPVVVTAARTSQPLPDALPQTATFDRQDIDDSGAVDLPTLLNLAPGAQIVTNGGLGSTSSLFLRGADQTLVLIDGVRADSVSLGTTQLSQLMLDQVDHVEVVNGNVSALYGSGAVGGVVQIFTKDGGNHPPRFSASTEYGSYHTQRQQAGVDGALDASGDTTFSLAVSRLKTDGFAPLDTVEAPGANPNAGGFIDTSASGSLKHRINADWDAGVRFFVSNGTDDYASPFGAPTDVNLAKNRVGTLSAFTDGKLTDRWTTHLIVADGSDHNANYLNGQSNGRFNTDNRQLTWQNEYALMDKQKLVFGYERLDQSLDSDQFTAPDRRVNSGFVGYQGSLGAHELQLNVRRDDYSDFGGANSYYAGYGYNFDAHWKAIASLSDSFRAPTFDDLYFPFFGNPTLRPQRSHSVETALQYASKALGVMRVSAFETRFTDLIQPTQIAPGAFAAENVGRAKVQGVETSWSGHLGRTELRASFTVQNPVDEVADQDLTRRPRRFASLAAARSFGDWRVGGQWFVSGPRNDSGTPLGGYGVVDLTARYAIDKSWYVAASLDNLLDKRYETAYAYNTPRRSAFVTLGWVQH